MSPRPPDPLARQLVSGWFYWPACLGGILLMALAVIGPEAQRRLNVESQCAAMQTEVDALSKARDQMAAAERALRQDPAYTERIVRHELGIVRTGETPLPRPMPPLGPMQPTLPPAPRDTMPLLAFLARFSDTHWQFTALVIGGALLVSAVLFSLPAGKQACLSRPK